MTGHDRFDPSKCCGYCPRCREIVNVIWFDDQPPFGPDRPRPTPARTGRSSARPVCRRFPEWSGMAGIVPAASPQNKTLEHNTAPASGFGGRR